MAQKERAKEPHLTAASAKGRLIEGTEDANKSQSPGRTEWGGGGSVGCMPRHDRRRGGDSQKKGRERDGRLVLSLTTTP